MVDQLLELGVTRGGVLLVHTAFSKIGPVEGGPRGLIAALRATLGPSGTLVMPSMSDDDEHPCDARTTPCAGMGMVASMFWQMPGVLRSDSPHAFAAIGPHATRITADHPMTGAIRLPDLMQTRQFKATLKRIPGKGGWTCVSIAFSFEDD